MEFFDGMAQKTKKYFRNHEADSSGFFREGKTGKDLQGAWRNLLQSVWGQGRERIDGDVYADSGE